MNIRRAVTEDLDFLHEVRNDELSVKFSKRGPLNRDTIHNDYFMNPKKKVYIAEAKGKNVGYLIYEDLGNGEAEISVAVARRYRKQGYGKKLVEQGTEFGLKELLYRKIVATIFSSNKVSLQIFEKCGYKVIDDTKGPWMLEYCCDETNTKKRVFVFDFDGVIVDSNKELYDIYMKFLEMFGHKGSREEFEHLMGPKLSEIVAYLKEKYNIANNLNDLEEKYTQMVESLYDNLTIESEVKDVLGYLKKNGFEVVLASSCRKLDILKVLVNSKLLGVFDFIVGGDDVKKAKPAPDIYNEVKNKCPHKEYYVVEDSDNGLISATRAGMKTCFFNPSKRNSKVNATIEVDNISEVKRVADELKAGSITIEKACKIEIKVVDYKPKIDKKIIEIVDMELERAKKEKGVFNGQIVCYKSRYYEKGALVVECYISEYKYYIAQLLKPELDLKTYPMAVSGIVIDNESKTLIGKRGKVTEYEGYYELVPSGGIEANKVRGGVVDYKAQLVTELEEECGIKSVHIKSIEPVCLTYDIEHQVYDICAKLNLKLDIKEPSAKKSGEYLEFKVVDTDKLKEMASKLKFVPTSLSLISNLS